MTLFNIVLKAEGRFWHRGYYLFYPLMPNLYLSVEVVVERIHKLLENLGKLRGASDKPAPLATAPMWVLSTWFC